ncbi:hypothetical protein E2I00_008869, partial [Balaenoptera physalus]
VPASLSMVFTELLEQAEGVGFFQALQVLTFFLLSVWAPIQLVVNFSAAVPGHRCCAHMLDNGSEAPANLTPEALLAVSFPLSPNQEPHHCLRFRQPQWQLLDPNAMATNWSEAATEPCVDGWVYDRSTFSSTIMTEHQPHRCPQFPCLRFLSALGLSGIILISATLSGSLDHLPQPCRGGEEGAQGHCTWPSPAHLPRLSVVERTTTCTRAVTVTILRCTCSIGQTAMGSLAFALWDRRALQLALLVPFLVIFLISWSVQLRPFPLGRTSLNGRGTRGERGPTTLAGHGSRVSRGQGQALPITLPIRTPFPARGWGRAMAPTFTAPVIAGGTDVQHGGGRSLCEVPPVRAGPVPYAHAPLEKLQTVGSEVCHIPPGAKEGGVSSGKTAPAGLPAEPGEQHLPPPGPLWSRDFRARVTTTLLLRFFGRHTTLAGSLAVAGLTILANMLVPQDLQTLHVILAVLGKGCFGISLTCIMVYKPELFPTSLRSAGVCDGPPDQDDPRGPSPAGHPPYGVIPIISNLIVLFLLETWGLPLPDTIQDLERQ